MTEGPRRLAVAVAALALASAVAGCGRDPSATAADRADRAEAARQPAELEADGVRIRASLVPTAARRRHRSVGRTIVVKCATVS